MFLINKFLCSLHIFLLNNVLIEERQKHGEKVKWNYLAKFYPSDVLKIVAPIVASLQGSRTVWGIQNGCQHAQLPCLFQAAASRRNGVTV